MAEKKVKKATGKTREERQYDILVREVPQIFDRVPQGSVESPLAHALIEKLNKA